MAGKKILLRSELPQKMTWDLSQIYQSDEAWKADLALIEEKMKPLLEFRGKLHTDAQIFFRFLDMEDNFSRFIEKLYTYAQLKSDEDVGNSVCRGMLDQISSLSYKCGAELAWVNPEIISIDDEVMQKLLTEKDLSFYKFAIERIRRYKPHILTQNEEKIMTMQAEIARVPYQAFSMLNNADIKFPEVPDGEGGTCEMSHGLYGRLLESKDRDVRKKAFDAMYDTFSRFRNTLAVTLDGAVKARVINARIRNYPSALEASLFDDRIDRQVFENLISVINRHLPLFHRYVELKKRVLSLPDLDMYDFYVPLVKELDIKVPWEKARTWVLDSIKPLGESYSKEMQNAFSDRWIDVLESRGKRSGAYSGGCYDTKPYVLMNYNDTLDSVFTLAHELGHSMHSFFSHDAQKYRYSEYPIFLAEVASTTNEMLLTDHLLKSTDDKRFKAYLLNHLCDEFKGTVFRQVQFSEFEKSIYEKVEANIPLTVDELNRTYYEINRKYYGPAIANPNRKIELEWSRIPHFYYNFYVYKYATGFSAAVCLSENILSGDVKKRDDYLGFLKAGSGKYPLDVLKNAGVDLSTPEPIIKGLKKFEEIIGMLESVL